ncbi:DNA integrity scanning diadenylate cyclase DisA [Aureibacillus halotolerans]|nr:DNA integrity scanning diadenylate cyclase DisA [Aureibacillus halotolerans]
MLGYISPGTPLREGIENVLRANTGGLIVVGYNETMRRLMDGGFRMDCTYTPSALYELAKMDGAIVLTDDGARILYANTQLTPNVSIGTSETGMRHRTAERVSKETGKLVVAISQRRQVITLYRGVEKYVLRDIGVILTKANQAVQTLEKYKIVFDQALTDFSALEFEKLVTLSELLVVVHRIEMLMKIRKEILEYGVELGVEGRLIKLQLKEILSEVEKEALLLLKDYCQTTSTNAQQIIDVLQEGRGATLVKDQVLAKLLGYPSSMENNKMITPAGYRLLSKVPRLPATLAHAIINQFGDFNQIVSSTQEAFTKIEGIGEVRAKAIADGINRLKEQVIMDRSM